MYQALYRKYRPRTFDDVVGQQHVTETLKRQIANGKTSHAYLFVGTRGTGKTTCAKILSRALNCLHPVDGNPCNECDNCLGIENGTVLDVEEIDAASNNGVDNIRALRDEAIFSPASAEKRVYIIDEVHMLSTSAFNALLKILEEPPEHLVFILATTEIRKVPATILSRCQRFSFRRITAEDIKGRLQYVCSREGLTLAEDAAELLARLADGSMRDALSLLDQCASSEEITAEKVLSTVGISGRDDTLKLFAAVNSGDVADALGIFDKLYIDGKDASIVINELMALGRDILLRKVAPGGSEALRTGQYSADELARWGKDVPASRLLKIIDEIQAALSAMAFSSDKRTAAEICLIKLCGSKMMPAEEVIAPAPAKAEEPAPAKSVPAPAPAPETAPVPVKEEPAPAKDEPDFGGEPETARGGASLWEEIFAAAKPALGTDAFMLSIEDAEVTGDTVVMNVANPFALQIAEKVSVKQAIADAALKVTGKKMAVTVKSGIGEKANSDKLSRLKNFGNVKFE